MLNEEYVNVKTTDEGTVITANTKTTFKNLGKYLFGTLLGYVGLRFITKSVANEAKKEGYKEGVKDVTDYLIEQADANEEKSE